MSRKTMAEYPELFNIWPPPATSHPQNDDTRARDLLRGALGRQPVSPAYTNYAVGHLEDANEYIRDAIWGINECKRDLRNIKE